MCNWPCNHTHDSEEINHLLSLKGYVEKFCNQLHSSSYGKCDLCSGPSRKVIENVSLILTHLSRAFKQCDPLLQFKWKMVGSTAENTKTGHPDEFDVLLLLDKLSRSIQDMGEGNLESNEMNPTEGEHIVQYLASNGKNHIITAKNLHLRIFRHLTSILANELPIGLLSFVTLKITAAGFTVFSTMEGATQGNIIKLDLIPAIKGQGSHLFVFKGQTFEGIVCFERNGLFHFTATQCEDWLGHC